MVRPPLSRAITARIHALGTWKRLEASEMRVSQRPSNCAGPMAVSSSKADGCAVVGRSINRTGSISRTMTGESVSRAIAERCADISCPVILKFALCAISAPAQSPPRISALMNPRDEGLAAAIDSELGTVAPAGGQRSELGLIIEKGAQTFFSWAR